MRPTRLLGIALVLLTAIAGGALALGVTLNASHAADVNGHEASGSHSVSASDQGASASTGLDVGVAKLDGTGSVTLPAMPEVPSLPDAPDLPSLPATPSVSGSAGAMGDASASAGDASASGHGAADVKIG